MAAADMMIFDTPELIVSSWDEYISVGAELCNDKEKYAAIRAKVNNLRETSPLFDIDRYAANLGTGIQKVLHFSLKAWQRYLAGSAPSDIDIQDSESWLGHTGWTAELAARLPW